MKYQIPMRVNAVTRNIGADGKPLSETVHACASGQEPCNVSFILLPAVDLYGNLAPGGSFMLTMETGVEIAAQGPVEVSIPDAPAAETETLGQ